MVGETLLQYTILEKLGEGGMGVVYKARDTKLDRFVALKFLPSHLSATEDVKARFIQEAKSASALNHPNVCTIHDIAEHNGQMFIVMEFVDGTSLTQRKNSMSEKQILEIGIQVAEGLAAAHEKGIVHRDIKPDNIMIRKDGIVQIMDFGLAKLFKEGNVSRITKAGSTMGTIGYMSPEQVQGHDVDHRTDIFSLGVVLYELLAGESPFKGGHETAIMYEIVNVDAPPIASLKAEFDPQLDGLILECLEKDRDDRLQSAKELAKNLRKVKRVTSGSRATRMYAAQPGTQRTTNTNLSGPLVHEDVPLGKLVRNIVYNRTILWSGLSLFFLSTIVLLALQFTRGQGSGRESMMSFAASIDPPPSSMFSFVSGQIEGGHSAVSPDGRMLVFVAEDSSGKAHLWVRQLDALTAQKLNGTEGAILPFWSHDSKYIGYFAEGKLKKILASGGPSITICKATTGRGGSWNKEDVIIFAPDQVGGIFQVSASGGEPKQITHTDTTLGESTHRWPTFLPGGKDFLYYSRVSSSASSDSDAICVASLDGKPAKRLFAAHSNCVFADDAILYVQEYTLMARPFDPDDLELTGEAIPVEENIMFSDRFNKGVFSASHNGVLVFQKGNTTTGQVLAWYDREGKQLGVFGTPNEYRGATISPDGKRLAVVVYDEKARSSDIWIYEIQRNILSRFTFSTADDHSPRWSPDGKWIVFSSDRVHGNEELFLKSSDGTGDVMQLTNSVHNKNVADWSPDGKYISYFGVTNPSTQWDVYILPVSFPIDTAKNKPRPLFQTESIEVGVRFSPDGRWISYVSNETGKTQVYVAPFPATSSGKWQLSTLSPTPSYLGWSGDGKAVFFGDENRRVAMVKVTPEGSGVNISNTEELFEFPFYGRSRFNGVSKDGNRFLFVIPIQASEMPPLTIVTNWSKKIHKGDEEV